MRALSSACGSVMTTCACSATRCFVTSSAGDSRVSPVFALNANPNSAIRFPATVLNIVDTIRRTKRASCHSFIRTTDSQ